ncbi:hypothetical protein LCGC14_2614000, partial [marine sediment metagenome]
IRTDGTNVRKWAITAPGTKPTVAAGSGTGLTGTYSVRYTYVVLNSSNVVLFESNPSPVSDDVALSNQDLDVSAMVISENPEVTNIRVYRTVAGGSLHLFDVNNDEEDATVTLSQADTALGSALQTDNSPPPTGNLLVMHYEHAFIDGDSSNPGILSYSKRLRPQSHPSTQFLEMNMNDPGRMIVPWGGILMRFTRDTKYRVVGVDINTFFSIESPSRRGILLGRAATAIEQGVIYASNDGVFLTNGINDVELSRDIRPLFEGRTVDGHPPLNRSTGNHVMEFYKGKLYFGYASGSNTEPDRLAVYNVAAGGWAIHTITNRALFYEDDTDIITMGDASGFTKQIEVEGSTDDADSNITVNILTGEVAGNGSNRFKQYRRAHIDLNSVNENVTLALNLDGIEVETHTVSRNGRGIVRQRLNSGRLGQRGSLRLTYTGQQDIRVGDISLIYNELGV